MKVKELIAVYQYKYTNNIAIEMDDTIIFSWDADKNRHPDDGSYSNVLYHMPDDIADAVVDSFTVIPQYMACNNKIVKLADVETLYIIIPIYSKLYKYSESSL